MALSLRSCRCPWAHGRGAARPAAAAPPAPAAATPRRRGLAALPQHAAQLAQRTQRPAQRTSSSITHPAQHQQHDQHHHHHQQQQARRAGRVQAAAASSRTSYLAELPSELPPTRSCSQGLEALNGTQLAVQAADWGYQQLGVPFPEGVPVQALAARVPDSLLQPDMRQAWGALALSLGLMAAGAAWLWLNHSLCPLWQRAACWLLLGTGYYGAFQTACDCARCAFLAATPQLADALGAALMAPGLFSYETWRLKWFNHLRHVNMLDVDTDAWQPLTLQQLAAMPPWRRKLAQLLGATPLRFLSSVGQWAAHFEAFDLKCHPKLSRPYVLAGWALPCLFAGLAWPALLTAGGAEAWVNGWLMPWLVFHGWLSFITMVHHTAPHIPWVEEGLEYDHGQATVNGTVTMVLPRWLEAVLHHSNYDLPKHLLVGVPSYRCRQVHEHLLQRLGPYLTTAAFNLKLVINLMTAWLVYDRKTRCYISFDAADERLEGSAGGGGGGGGAATSGSDRTTSGSSGSSSSSSSSSDQDSSSVGRGSLPGGGVGGRPSQPAALSAQQQGERQNGVHGSSHPGPQPPPQQQQQQHARGPPIGAAGQQVPGAASA